MWQQLPSILQRFFLTGGPRTRQTAETPELWISGLEEAPGALPEDAVILYKECAPLPSGLSTGRRLVAVVDSGGGDALLEQVSATRLPAVTCGLSARDTLSLSSFSTDSAVVALQRSLPCFDGSVIEPQEIPLALGAPMDSFTLLAAVSVFLLTGYADRLSDAHFLPGQYK